MTVNDIIDEFYEYLTPQQIEELEMYYANYFPGNEIINPMTIKTVESIYNFEGEEYALDRIPVYRTRWKSFRKMGNFYYLDPQTGEEQQILVDEGWVWDKEDKSQRVEWFWVSEYWEGIRIGADMYIDEMIRRRPQQFRSMDNLSKCKSGYVGRLCSAQNSQSTSFMDRSCSMVVFVFHVPEKASRADDN